MASPNNNTTSKNWLLQALTNEDLPLLTPSLALVDLHLRMPLEDPNQEIENVYFFEGGMASVVGRGPRRRQLEIGLIGREGMSGAMVILGNDRSPHSTYMQLKGTAHRIASTDLRVAMDESGTLQRTLLRYVQAFMIQATYTAIANGSARLEERLARWLLMARDRTDSDELPLVHEFLALMLGVRRPGVTTTLHALEQQGVIAVKRGNIILVDRRGLERIANAAYGVPEAEYDRRMGRERTPS